MRYVLEGSVRRSGNQVRVNAQLIDAETDAHLWAERFDRDTGDLFALQNEITSRIAVALDLELIGAEAARPTERPDALDYILRGRAASGRSPYARELSRKPSTCSSARWRSIRARSRRRAGWRAHLPIARSTDMTDTAAAPTSHAPKSWSRRLLAASPRNPHMRITPKAGLLRIDAARARRQFPNTRPRSRPIATGADALVRPRLVQVLDRGIDRRRSRSTSKPSASARAIRRSAIGIIRIGMVHLLQSRIDEAIAWLEKARSLRSDDCAGSRSISRRRLCPQRRAERAEPNSPSPEADRL